MYNLKIKTLKKPILLIIAISIWIIFPIFTQIITINEKIETVSNSQETEIDQMQMQPQSFLKWKELIAQADHNENGINDNLEIRLKELSEVGYIEVNEWNSDDKNTNNELLGIQPRKTDIISVDDIPIIVSFPGKDYDSSLLHFKELGGNVKSTYNAAINGFAGSINYDGLIRFSKILQQNKVPFLIEEDKKYQTQLYYASRNMNLRPYVWNTLSYDGDEYSSIAIIDTGVDESHNFFSPGYSAGDFSYKIVGWRDEINALSTPYDDNGHGSHCSGIAAGIGSPSYDVSGRSVTTAAYNFTYTGYDVSDGTYLFNWTRFNVTDPGLIELFCEFDDFTPGLDDVDFSVYLYHGNTMVDSYVGTSDSWFHTLSYSATSGSLGLYSWRIAVNLIDNTGDGAVSDFDIRFRAEIHWPFDPPQFGSGDPWKGVASDARLVGVKVLDEHGGGSSSDVINGINWVINNKLAYNITTMSLSLGGPKGDVALINAVNNAVENGIVTVVSAGNEGPMDNNVGSPGDADNVITVAAMNINDEITDYSSQGGPSYTTNTIKPDITAPGGSFNNLQMFSADTNDNDAETVYPTDVYANDMMGAQGTSMSAPAVAGASNLLIEAMGGHENWGYTSTEAKRVKALLLMSATETYPLERESYGVFYKPTLDRGGKDVHEGYGRINVDIAIEACTQELIYGSQKNAWITTSVNNAFDKHGLGCYVNLVNGEDYLFNLDVPSGADFDLHLYSENGSAIGEPIMVASSTSAGDDIDESISYTPTVTGKYYLIAKAISGEGNAIISYPQLDHDLQVTLEVPTNAELGNSYIINATVKNTGDNPESNVELFLYLDELEINSTSILSLPVDVSKTINYTWIPTEYRSYNFTAYAPSVPSETFLGNNIVTEIISIVAIKLFDGMYIELLYSEAGMSYPPSNFSYTPYSGTLWYETWNLPGFTWIVDAQTREMSGGSIFGDGTHTPAWIFTDINLGDNILIAVDGDGDHTFNVSSEFIYNIPGYGIVEVWELLDLDLSGGWAWYEKSTGILLYGNFPYAGGASFYTVDFMNTNALFSYITLDHDLEVSLEIPSIPELGSSYVVNATVINNGLNDEYDVDLLLYLDGIVVNSTTIPTLPIGESKTINYTWNPTTYKTYNFTSYAPPLPSEMIIANNDLEELVTIFINLNYTMTEGAPYTWIDASGGTELYLGDDDSAALSLPFDFTFYNDSFSTIYLSSNGYLSFTDSNPTQFSNIELPSGDPYHYYMIAPFWDDIYTPNGGNIYYQSFGTYWVAEWLNIYHIDDYVIGSFEVVLYDTGEILFNYDYLDYTSGDYTCGLNLGVDTGFYNSYQGLTDSTDNFTLLFTPWWANVDHDLSVSIETPMDPEIGHSYLINATVINTGLNDEYDVELFLYLDGTLMNSTNISTLSAGNRKTVNYMWTPISYGTYNFTAYAPVVPDEAFLENNKIIRLLSIRETIFYEDFESGLSNWETINGLWHLTDDSSIWPNPCYSPTHSMWFGNETTGDYDTGYREMGDLISEPIDLSLYQDPILEFYHWREGEIGFDYSYVYISIDGTNWDLIYQTDSQISVWQKVSLNISGYAGYQSVQLKFSFDTNDAVDNGYRGWLVDDIEISGISILTITNPDSSSSWKTGNTHSITWTLGVGITDVKIELFKDGVFLSEIIASTTNDGEFSWTIPSGLVDSTKYQIKVSDVSNPTMYDFSENFKIFTTQVSPPPEDSLTINNPNSLTVWEKGTSQDITWTSTGSISAIKIELFKDGVLERIIIASTSNDGSYNWTIPTDLEDGTDYQIKISDVSNSAVYDESPNFTITSAEGGGRPGIPSYNIYFIMVIIGVIGVVLLKKNALLIK